MTHIQSIENGQLGRFKSQGADKLRGGYYTSAQLANWLCNWAIRRIEDRVLEPSCGDGVFLSAALERFAAIGEFSPSSVSENLRGIEVIPEEAEKARELLRNRLGQNARNVIHTGDFFEWWQRAKDNAFDAIVGNPPFIRYQSFPEPYRARAMEIMAQVGLKPNRLTNIWVPFVAAAAASLRPGGRLALVLPAELLQVSYAAQSRSFLADKFSTIDIITCNELFFDKAEQEVVLLLADGALPVASVDNECRVTMTEFDTVSEVTQRLPRAVLANTQPKAIRHDNEKWLKYLLTPGEITLMRELRESPEITNLSTHANVDVGVVTGKNSFFVLNTEQITELGLLEYTIPLISRSAQLRGAYIREDDWQDLAAAGNRVHLLHLAPLNGDPLKKSLEEYIRLGEAQGVHAGYKCSIRSPWYAVPSVWEPQGFLFRQIYDFPRIVLNDAGATSTDTIHRLNCKVDSLVTRAFRVGSAA